METITTVLPKLDKLKEVGGKNYSTNQTRSYCDPDCPRCGGFGFVRYDRPIDHPRFGKLEPCPNLDPVKLYGPRVGLNEKELNLSWNSLIDYNKIGLAVKEIKKAIDDGYGWLFVWGVYGLGKTTLLKTAISEVLRSGRQGAFVRMVDVMDDLKKAFSVEDPSEKSINRLEFWTDVPVLAIDEFDRVRLTDFNAERRFVLMDHRYENAIRGNSINIMASNGDPRDLDAYLADRVFDGRFKVIHLTGNSFRPNLGE